MIYFSDKYLNLKENNMKTNQMINKIDDNQLFVSEFQNENARSGNLSQELDIIEILEQIKKVYYV